MVSPAPIPPRELRLGVIGLNEGNGHPYSFSAIVNGFDDAGMAAAGWDVIYQYLRQRDAADFGMPGVRVTHAWTQDRATTEKLARAARIPHVVDEPSHMLGQIDALLLLRDDYETHLPLARPFLEAGLPVFIDKPLSVDLEELRYFRPFLESGQLMSSAGMRYARELDQVAATVAGGDLGELVLVRGAVVSTFNKYGIHLLDGIFRLLPFAVTQVWAVPGAGHESVVLLQEAGHPMIQLDALGATVKTFQIDVWGRKGRTHAEWTDNFSAFRREVAHFVDQVRTGQLAISPTHTLNLMRVLIAAARSRAEGRAVPLAEVVV